MLNTNCCKGRHGHYHMVHLYLDLQLHVLFLPISTNVVSSNPDHGEVYSIQHNVIKFVSDLRPVGGFHRVLRFLSTNNTDHHVESGVTHHSPSVVYALSHAGIFFLLLFI